MFLRVISSLLEIKMIPNHSVQVPLLSGNDADKLQKETDLLKLEGESFVNCTVVTKQNRYYEYIPA
jgi:hypothetical protein